MGKTFKEDVHESSTNTPTPSSVEHPDTDQLEVSSQPGIGDLMLQHPERVVGPPLAVLTRVAVGEADEHVGVVRAGEAKSVPDAVLAPDGPVPRFVVGVIAED